MHKQLFLCILLVNVIGCSQNQPIAKKTPSPNITTVSKGRLFLNNATLEQANEKGQTLWKIKAGQTLYSEERKITELKKLTGNLFQDGKIILAVSAERGEIKEDAKQLFLKGKIVAKDVRNQMVFEGKEIEWIPQQDLAIVKQNLTIRNAKVRVVAKMAKYHTRSQKLELNEQIIAIATEPKLQIKTEHLFWEIPQETLFGDRRLEIGRYRENTITDVIEAERGRVNLKENTAILERQAQLKSLTPPLQIVGSEINWNYQTRLLKSLKPLQILHTQKQITLTGNQSEIDLEKQIARLQGGVKGINLVNSARLYANEVFWNIPSEIIEATGQIIYEQNQPQYKLTGSKAVGKLQENKIIVTNDNGKPVITKISP